MPYVTALDMKKLATAAPAVGSADGDGGGGPGGVELVDVDELPADPDDADIEMSSEERLRKDAVSVRHLLTQVPKNPRCATCQFEKALRQQQRQKNIGAIEFYGRVRSPRLSVTLPLVCG